ncbi:D-alanyl-D-alanine carboxypeptidase [Streptomyces sp. NPDC057702]|uniref:D-alanyl-D-alanine carboxypeptidase n=1 Tax=unclassified Streptomyces TaxID=2593676 RepID=UPI003677B74D
MGRERSDDQATAVFTTSRRAGSDAAADAPGASRGPREAAGAADTADEPADRARTAGGDADGARVRASESRRGRTGAGATATGRGGTGSAGGSRDADASKGAAGAKGASGDGNAGGPQDGSEAAGTGQPQGTAGRAGAGGSGEGDGRGEGGRTGADDADDEPSAGERRGEAARGGTVDADAAGADPEGQDRATAVLRAGALPTRRGADAASGSGPDTGADADADGVAAPTSGGSGTGSGSGSGSGSGAKSRAADAPADSSADAEAGSADGERGIAAGGDHADRSTPARDARLRAAVAAWVAKAGPDDRDDEASRDRPAAGGDAPRQPGAAPTSTAGGTSRTADAGGSGDGTTDGAAARTPSDGAADSLDESADGDSVSGSASGASGVAGTPADRATAVFGAVHGAAAGKRVARDEAARRVTDGARDGGSTGAGDRDGARDQGRGASDGAGGSDRRAGGSDGGTGTGGGQAGKDAGRTGKDGGATGVRGERGGGDPARPARTTSGDTPTSVFGTLRPQRRDAADDPSGERDTAAATDRDKEAGRGADQAPGKGKDVGGSATSDRDAGRSRAAGAGGRADADAEDGTVDRPTTAFKALRPSDTPSAGTTGAATDRGTQRGRGAGGAERGQAASRAESGAERTSQFVPLKSADERPAKPTTGTRGAAASATTGAVPEAERTARQPVLDPEAVAARGATAAPDASQAVGPQAPLDLLAQLTNTPPPPQTLTRTVVRRVKIWTPLVLLVAILFGVAQSVRPLPTPTLELTASETFTFDGAKPAMPWPASGQAVVEVEGLGSLGAYGEEKPAPIASVAKVMTAYVIMRDHPMKAGSDGPKIRIDPKAAADAGKDADGESVVKVDEGAQITQREAIESIMIASANNIARLLARWDSGTEAEFVKKMNEAAKDLGMRNTTYTDPSGLNATTVSTAADQVKLAKKAMDNPVFREVVKMPKYKDSRGEEHGNWNHLVPFDNVVGIKTGTTTKAGGNLVFAAEKEIGGTTQLIIGAVISQPPAKRDNSILTGALDASKKLILTTQDLLQARKVVKKGDVVGEVDDGLGGKTPVVAVKDVTAVGWPGLTVDLELTDGGKKLPHEAAAGTEIGTLTVGEGPGQVKVPVALADDLSEPSFGTKLVRVT